MLARQRLARCFLLALALTCVVAAESVPGVKVTFFNPAKPDQVNGVYRQDGFFYDGFSPMGRIGNPRGYPEAARWTAKADIAQAGTHRFRLATGRWTTPTLTIDDKPVSLTSERTGKDQATHSGEIDLAAGPHRIAIETNRVNRRERDLTAFSWAGPDGVWRSMAAGPFTVEPWPGMQEDPQRVALRQLKDGKLGVFIHFDVNSAADGDPLDADHDGYKVPREEWVKRMKLAEKTWDLPDYDPEAWVEMFRDMGAQWIVFTAMHVFDQFAMWDSKVATYKITNTPYGKDVLKQLTDVCAAHGMPIQLYCGPNYQGHSRYSHDDINRMVEELISGYGKLAGFWGDGGLPLTTEMWLEVYRRHPGALAVRAANATHHTEEFGIGRFSRTVWERCWHFKYDRWFWERPYPSGSLPLQGAIIHFVQVVGNGGVLTMNLPPNPRGGYDPGIAELCGELGEWMRAYGEAIRGTEGGPYYYDEGVKKAGRLKHDAKVTIPWGATTCKGKKVYLHLLTRPKPEAIKPYQVAMTGWSGETLTLPALPDRRIVTASVLGRPDATVQVQMDVRTLTVTVPEESRDPIDTIVVLELDHDAESIEPINLWKPAE